MLAKKKSEHFTDALEECGAEGFEILTKKSSPFVHGVIYILIGLLFAVFVWSFYGKANVVIMAQGKLDANSEMIRVYTPTPGELIDIYVKEGMPVSRGDLLARIKAAGAIRAAADADQAKMQLEKAELEKKIFPQKKRLLEKEIENIKQQLRQKGKDYNQLKKEKFQNLPTTQKHQLKKTSLSFEEAENNRDMAKRAYEKYVRLYETPGNGGVSKKEVEEKELQYIKAETAYQNLRIDVEKLELEFSKQETQAGKKLGDAYIALLTLRFQRDSKIMQMENEEKQLNMKYRSAHAAWEAASVVTFDDLDEDNFLKVRAPVSGVITYVASTQRGEKVKSEAPLVSIAPADAEKILRINIQDKDRGLLKAGQSVKLKFAAFPYQRYGFIKGTLEYISPNAESSNEGSPFYKGRVGLEQDYFMVNDKKTELKYGMTAEAEIVVQKRRLIDLALDPFRKFKGIEN
ncbi:HlyD family efflux transporter periplasmic adaptor subunit [Desulfonema magnum]|uniref:HylD family secretion domain-containing protein n=1 Tax=Desulfonema magnum TaxID=45655 RepID=A0A975BQP3_9BACT|nr:HlyD family efflux transporter periplasmic adaptor subunit [Desulfonema magnum]QTA89932.1 HylD family secretion domain-containing protein [Desulfonema magnum]